MLKGFLTLLWSRLHLATLCDHWQRSRRCIRRRRIYIHHDIMSAVYSCLIHTKNVSCASTCTTNNRRFTHVLSQWVAAGSAYVPVHWQNNVQICTSASRVWSISQVDCMSNFVPDALPNLSLAVSSCTCRNPIALGGCQS